MKKNFDDRKKHIENELIEKCKCDEKTITLIDNIMTYAIGNVLLQSQILWDDGFRT